MTQKKTFGKNLKKWKSRKQYNYSDAKTRKPYKHNKQNIERISTINTTTENTTDLKIKFIHFYTDINLQKFVQIIQ